MTSTTRTRAAALRGGRNYANLSLADSISSVCPARGDQAGSNGVAQLAQASPRDDWAFPDPFLRPIVKKHHGPLIQNQDGGRVDLWWLNQDGSIARQKADVWPRVREVFYDGSFYSMAPTSSEQSLVLTSPNGEVLAHLGERNGGPAAVEPRRMVIFALPQTRRQRSVLDS